MRNRFGNPKLKIASLAVLPLDNLSGEPGQDYFAEGMTDELITMLAKNSTLRIGSRTSAMHTSGHIVHYPKSLRGSALKAFWRDRSPGQTIVFT